MLAKMFMVAGMISGFIVGSVGKIVDCSSSTSKFSIQSLEFHPDPPTKNQNATITMIYDAPVLVDNGKVDYSITLNGLPVYSETSDLCTQTACPINIGTHNETSVFLWPDVSGKVVAKTVWKDEHGSELLCFQTSSTSGTFEKVRLRGSTHIRNHKSLVIRENKVSFGISTCLNAVVPYFNSSDIHYHDEL
jgi:hypothetical protein